MNPTFQSGMHPDAEVLTAFAEQLVSDTEREEILAHIASCGRCREVVFLTQRMVEGDESSRSAAASLPEAKGGSGWFSGWRWAWIPVAALAGVVGFAVIEHSRQAAAPTTQMAQNGPPPEPALSTAATETAQTQPSSQPSRLQSKEKLAPARRDRDAELDEKSLSDKDELASQKKDELAKTADALREVAPKETVGSSHGTLEARAKSSSVGGPFAQNQMQVQNNAQLQQNYANESGQSNALAGSANKPAASPIQPGATSQTVTVEAAGGPVPVAPVPSAAPALSAVQLETESADLREQKIAKAVAGKLVLPSKLGVLSQTKAGKTMVVIDTAGSVFVSEDAGRHWQAVNPQWRGRPVLVKPRPTLAAAGGLLKQSSPRFELTTDKHEIWVSEDGKSWTPEPLTR